MIDQEYYNEYFGYIECTNGETELDQIAQTYHQLTDDFDVIICTIQKYGEPMPENEFEFNLVNKNARNVFKLLVEKYQHQYTPNQILHAIKNS